MERLPSITDQIYAIPLGDSRVFHDQNRNTIRRIATRLQDKYERTYACRSLPADGGYQVWRLA